MGYYNSPEGLRERQRREEEAFMERQRKAEEARKKELIIQTEVDAAEKLIKMNTSSLNANTNKKITELRILLEKRKQVAAEIKRLEPYKLRNEMHENPIYVKNLGFSNRLYSNNSKKKQTLKNNIQKKIEATRTILNTSKKLYNNTRKNLSLANLKENAIWLPEWNKINLKTKLKGYATFGIATFNEQSTRWSKSWKTIWESINNAQYQLYQMMSKIDKKIVSIMPSELLKQLNPANLPISLN